MLFILSPGKKNLLGLIEGLKLHKSHSPENLHTSLHTISEIPGKDRKINLLFTISVLDTNIFVLSP